jgi:hypothetical protein
MSRARANVKVALPQRHPNPHEHHVNSAKLGVFIARRYVSLVPAANTNGSQTVPTTQIGLARIALWDNTSRLKGEPFAKYALEANLLFFPEKSRAMASISATASALDFWTQLLMLK